MTTLFSIAVPGCVLWCTPDLLAVSVPAGGAVSVALSVPPTPSLVGSMLHPQFAEVALVAGGIGAVRTSDGLTLVLGSY